MKWRKHKTKERNDSDCENAYTLSRKRFSPAAVFNSANVSSSFIEREKKKELKMQTDHKFNTSDGNDKPNRVNTQHRFLFSF